MHSFRRARRAISACLSLLVIAGITAAYALMALAVWPEASGDRVYEEGSMTIDASHMEDGYIQVRAEPTSNKLKLRISRGDTTYTYDLNGEGAYEVFPLQFGSGKYVCALYKNIKANKYAKDAEVSVSVELADENAAFRCPSQYVNYTQESPAVLASEEICANLETDAEKVEAIRSFMVGGFAYDYVRALTGAERYLGDVDGCFETRLGLCQDLAAVAACMLRVQGIPTQLVIGYAGEVYHAWNNVYIDGEYQHLDITAELGGFAKNTVYTPERYY